MRKPVYLDYMATCPVDPRVAEKMQACLTIDGNFGNASSTHYYGIQASRAVEAARKQVANLIHAKPQEIIWTSGATESINIALQGAALAYQRKGKHIITCKTEHKAVLACCQALARQGFEVTYLDVQENGLIDIEYFQQQLRDDTILVSLMHVNNEIGVIHDIATMGEMTRERGIIFHVDAAQSAGKLALDMQQLPIDLMSLSGHKIYGPKGIGALYISHEPRVRLEPIFHGAGQEQGLRSSTLPVHQIVGMGEAFAIAAEEREQDNQRITAMRNQIWEGLKNLEGVMLNGDLNQRVCGNLNVSVSNVHGEALLYGLPELALSSGSACSAASHAPSHVIKALGRSDQVAHNTLRISLGRFTTQEEVDFTLQTLLSKITQLQNASPI
jgi:cysteine desulfurase